MPPHLFSLNHPSCLPPPFCDRPPAVIRRSRRNHLKVYARVGPRLGCRSRRYSWPPRAFDDGFVDIPPLDDWGDDESISGYVLSSSENEDSDGEIVISAAPDADLPRVNEMTNEALAVTAHRFAMLGRRRRRRRIRDGIFITLALITFLTVCLLLLDLYAWRIVRLPLPQFYLTRPFFISAATASCLGYVFVPFLRSLNIYHTNQTEGLARPLLKKITPTMGGLFFVPVGVAVAEFIVGFSSVEVTAAAAATLIYAVIGLLDDTLSLIKDQNHYLSTWLKLSLEARLLSVASFLFGWRVPAYHHPMFSSGILFATVGSCLTLPVLLVFCPSFWAGLLLSVVMLIIVKLYDSQFESYDSIRFKWLAIRISVMNHMKMLVPLPSPLGLVFLGKFYLLLTSFCFVSTGNGINIMDSVDGLAGGIAALAFIAMSIVVLPICADLAIFGSSMAGACIGFLLHNRYKASVFMGETGSLALGGALAAMAACTGMFFPLFISCGVSVVEALLITVQASYFKATKCSSIRRHGRCRIMPLHHRLLLHGFKEPAIVTAAYIISLVFCLFAGYTGLASA